ncbi:hypothetical protein EMCRGX_G012443 [Ephydatia muelleri]|eukprot:Em0004g23a
MASPSSSPTVKSPEILFESYLSKTSPLEKLFVSWKKRWFVLARTDRFDPSSVLLVYYSDKTKREKKGVLSLQNFRGIRPNVQVGSKQFVFAIETQERKYILRASDPTTKGIWLAKLSEHCGQERVHHVTIPQQPLLSQSEGLLNLSSPASVMVLSPDGSTIIVQIAYRTIRRLGCMLHAGVDVVWFETCKDPHPDEFVFCVVPSGTEMAQHIIRELKVSIEQHTGVFLILEEAESQDSIDISFISRDHYGCEEFSSDTRARILRSGLSHYHPICGFSATPPPASPSTTSQPSTAAGSMSLDAWGRGRHKSVSTANITGVISRRATLSDLHHNSLGSTASSHNSVDGLDSNIFSDTFESSPQTTPPRITSPPTSPLCTSSPRTGSPRTSSPRTGSPRTGSPCTDPPVPQRPMKHSASFGCANILSVNATPTVHVLPQQLRRQTHSVPNATTNGPVVPPRSVNSLRKH